MNNVVTLADFRRRPAPADSTPLTRRELERKVRRGKSTIFAWLDEGMPANRAPGGNTYDWPRVKRWLEEVKGWTFDAGGNVGDGHIPIPEEDRQNG